jgi:hypothetical protein
MQNNSDLINIDLTPDTLLLTIDSKSEQEELTINEINSILNECL